MEWRPTKPQVLWAAATVAALVVLFFIGVWLWGVLFAFIQPDTPTEKKDVVNVFVVIGAGVVGSLTAIAAVGNLYISRRNLQQQRDLDERRAQDDVLQAYFEQMGRLLTDHKLVATKRKDDPLRLLAQAQTLTTLTVLDRSEQWRKANLLLFLYRAGLINKDDPIVDLLTANLSGVILVRTDLRGANLHGANLSHADFEHVDLQGANFGNANLRNANLKSTDLRDATLSGAVLIGTNLSGAKLERANVEHADIERADLSGAVLCDANLKRVGLQHANLEHTNLIGADLQRSGLKGANLRGAYLNRADLTRVYLKDATVTRAQLSVCKSLMYATMPDGQSYEDWLYDTAGRRKNADNAGYS